MRRPKIGGLPQEVRAWLDRELLDAAFGNYDEIVNELNLRLEQAGADFRISRTGLHRYGQNLERKLAAIKASTQAAQAIAEAAPDDADLLGASVIQMVQTEVFNVLVELQEAESEDDPALRMKLLGSVAKSIAELSRVSVNQKKWKTEIADKIRAEERAKTAEAAAGAAKQAGASDDLIGKIRTALAVF
jgi:hypothetical protein